jgi:hypothetical protein
MPLTYDQSRCCGELLAKNKIQVLISKGFTPVHAFEVPTFENGEDIKKARQKAEKAAHDDDGWEVVARTEDEDAPQEAEKDQEEGEAHDQDGRIGVIYNHKSGTLHRTVDTLSRETRCTYVRGENLAGHFEYKVMDPSEVRGYVRCPQCWKGNDLKNITLPTWKDADDSGSNAESSSDSGSSSSDDDSTS